MPLIRRRPASPRLIAARTGEWRIVVQPEMKFGRAKSQAIGWLSRVVWPTIGGRESASNFKMEKRTQEVLWNL